MFDLASRQPLSVCPSHSLLLSSVTLSFFVLCKQAGSESRHHAALDLLNPLGADLSESALPAALGLLVLALLLLIPFSPPLAP